MTGQSFGQLNGWVFVYELSGCGFESVAVTVRYFGGEIYSSIIKLKDAFEEQIKVKYEMNFMNLINQKKKNKIKKKKKYDL